MLTHPKTLEKLRRLETIYHALIVTPVQPLACRYFETDDHRRAVPGPDVPWQPCPSGTEWGHPGGSAWFIADAVIPDELDGQPVWVIARTGGVEAMFWRDGEPAGLFNYDPWVRIRGDHRAQRVTAVGRAGERFTLAFEAYAGHPVAGCQPFETEASASAYPPAGPRRFDQVALARRDDEVAGFVFDLRALNQLSRALPADSFRKGSIDVALVKVFALVPQDPSETPATAWRPALAEARAVMRPLLAKRNGDSAPVAGIVGHSHMDTAWLWTIDETIRKCARTYANALHLMEQDPDYRFIQSSALHADWMRRHYPSIFAGIVRRVAEGRWEPNGASWIEPDVNLAGGEALVRQFLFGQAFTRAHFGYTADTFWLPDTFGYSAALPQILRGAGLRHFATTKLSWNETNPFPHDTFHWEGIDGSRVFTHFPDIHCAPDPAALIGKLHGGADDFRVVDNAVRHKDVNAARLIAYGFGDGGGGPDPDMLEMARRCRDLEGCPRAEPTTAGAFLRRLEAETPGAPVYVGELYLELHRGTLTQLHEIKRRNRHAEFALREAEVLAVLAGWTGDAVRARLDAAWRLLLINHFHDILPGTSIPEVHDRAVVELGEVVDAARALAAEAAATATDSAAEAITVFNTLGWTRDEAVLTGLPAGTALAGVRHQTVIPPWGEERLVVEGLALPPLGARSFVGAPAALADKDDTGVFAWDGATLRTPVLTARFDPAGGLASVRLATPDRELAAEAARPLNTFLFGEDIPAAWDNWDVDADLALKLAPALRLESRVVTARGPLQFRVRQTFAFGAGSRLVQDIVFHAAHARIDFETLIAWREKHRFLAVEFPLAVRAPTARHEIQYGHVERPTHRNTSEDRARFEVCQHKWTDLSENRFGVALLNDGKYGVSVDGGTIRLSLHKGGCHPDPRGDPGGHVITYSLLPHDGAFTAESVVRPAYQLNLAPTTVPGAADLPPLFTLDAPNIVVEAIKPAEDGRGIIVRLYECERQATTATLRFTRSPAAVYPANLLEENQSALPVEDGAVRLTFHPFGIRTLRILA